MPKLVAFLRAINVGGHTVSMDTLRREFEAIGLKDVETFIASGNVIFDARSGAPTALDTKIEKHLETSFGYEVGVFLRSIDELAAVAAYEPFARPGAATVLVVFLKHPLDPEASKRIMALRSETDDFRAHGRELYWLSQRGAGGSPVAPVVGRIVGKQGTMRNVTTVRKLAAKYCTSA